MAEIEAEINSLQESKTAIESSRQIAEREFRAKWEQAVEDLRVGLKEAELRALAEIANRIQGTPAIHVPHLAKQLPTIVMDIIEESVHPVATDFEQRATRLAEKFQASYPQLSLIGQLRTAAAPVRGNSAVLGAAGGVALAASGVGLATAGSIAAANAATASVLTVPTLASSVLSSVSFLQWLAPAFTGTVAMPTATTIATPLWVALSGPIGWTMAGLGLSAVPFAWYTSKRKQKEELDAASRQQIEKIFRHLTSDRINALRRMGESIIEEMRVRIDRQVAEMEVSLKTFQQQRPSEEDIAATARMANRLCALLRQGIAFCGKNEAPLTNDVMRQ